MEELGQRLVEIECVLNKMDQQNMKKIPKEFWEFMSNNKDTNYNFQYDDSKSITENNLHIDTIALLTYINILSRHRLTLKFALFYRTKYGIIYICIG